MRSEKADKPFNGVIYSENELGVLSLIGPGEKMRESVAARNGSLECLVRRCG